MLSAKLDLGSLAAVRKVIDELGFNARKELRVAVSKTQKQVQRAAARKLKTIIRAPIRILKRAIVNGKSTNDGLSALVLLRAGYKVPVKYLGARQTKKGISYRDIGGKGFVPSGFKVKKYSDNAYTRKAKSRGPLQKIVGPAPGDVYESGGVTQVALATAAEQLPKQIQERVRFLTLKAQGKLK